MIRLLQIDDDPADVRLLRAALEECALECDIRTAPDGLAALELLRASEEPHRSWKPDLILCDLNMPRMNGHAFLDEVKADRTLRRIPVIMFSSSPGPEDISRAYTRQVNCFVCKPAKFDDLCVVAKRIGEFWFTTAELPAPEAA